MMYVVFALVFLTVMALINFYIYRRFLRKVLSGKKRIALSIPWTLMLGEVFFILDAATHIIPDSPVVYYITSAFVGFSFMLFVVATFYDLTITVSSRVPFDAGRRNSIKVIFDVTMLVAAAAYLLRGLSQGIRPPRINPVHVAIKDFPADEFRIVQLTDIHVGRTIGHSFVVDMVQRTNALKPDMVVITGDLFDLPPRDIQHALLPLQELEAPSYFILGNHEYFHGAEEAIAMVRDLGIRPLLNESVVVEAQQGRFNLVGINDLVGERMNLLPPDVPAAFSQVDSELPCVVLFHQPKGIEHLSGQRCDLMLSGHTHGGQIFPFGLLVMMDQPYLAGLYQHNPETQIFVSRGTGYWGPPLRVLAPSEITHLHITST